jgi:protein gp37
LKLVEDNNIAWAHSTQNFWQGCDQIAPECAHCHIDRTLIKLGMEPLGEIRRTKTTWGNPVKWQKQAARENVCLRIFTTP